MDAYRYDSIGVGNHEFGALQTTMRAFWETAKRSRLPFNAANLTCVAPAKALCALLRTDPAQIPYRVVRRGGARIAILGLTDPTLRDVIAKTHEAGVTFGGMEESLRRWLPRMRRDADLVLVHAHVSSLRTRQELEASVTRNTGVDVLITNTPHDDPRLKGHDDQESTGYAVTRRTGTLVLRAGRDEEETTIARLTVTRRPDATWNISPAEVRTHSFKSGPSDPDAHAALERVHKDYCTSWGAAIGERVKLPAPWTAQRFEREVLEILRQTTHAEISMLNRGAFRNKDQFPLVTHLTLSDLYAALPFSTQIVIAEIQGENLKTLANHLAQGKLTALGLEKTDSGVQVNGRAVRPKVWYTIALNRYMAQGGDGLVQESWLRAATPMEGVLDTRLMEQWRARGIARPRDLHEHFRWALRSEVNASYKQVDVLNPAMGDSVAYTQPQLTVNPTSQINLEGKLGVHGDRRDHEVDAEALMQFATARVDDGDPNTVETFEETADRIQLKASYAFTGGTPAWWRPKPFLEAQLQSEFTRPTERTFHRFEVTGIGGARFQVLPPLMLKAGLNARSEIWDPANSESLGLNLGYTLTRTEVVTWRGVSIKVESNLEYFLNRVGEDVLQEVRNQNRALLGITDQLSVTLTLNIYGFRSESVGSWGRNTELMMGLHHELGGSFQRGL